MISRTTPHLLILLLCMAAIALSARGHTHVVDETADAQAWAVNFAKELEAAMAQRDVESVRQVFDIDALVARIFDGVPVPMADRMGYRAGMRMSFDWGAIVTALGPQGHYRFMRVSRSEEGEDHALALFRVVVAGGGFDYHGLLLRRQDDETVRIIDVRTLSTAEWASDTPHRKWRLNYAEGDDVKLRNALERIELLMMQGRAEEAMKVWHGLPDDAMEEPGIAIQGIIIASHYSFDELLKQADLYVERFPDDAASDMLLLSVWETQGEHDRMLASIARLRAFAGDDAFLDYVEGNAMYRMERKDEATKLFQRAVEREPGLIEPRLSLLTVALDAEDHGAVLDLLLAIESLGVELDDPATSPPFAKFVESPMYERWQQRQKEQ